MLREACNSWYYESAAATTTTTTRGVIEGPISTRALAKLYHQNNNCGEDNHYLRIAGTTRVYRNKQEGWKQIDQLDHLQLAMEAFREVVVGPPAVVQQDDGRDDVAAIAMTTAGRNHNQNANDNDSHVNNAAAVDQMIFDNNNNDDEDEQEVTTNHDDIINKQQQREREQNVADELEAFLSSTDHLAPHASTNTGGTKDNGDDDDQEEYESDGGTRYIRDCQSGNWIHEHEAVMMQRQRGGTATANDGNNNGTTIGQSSNGDKNVTEATAKPSSTTATTTKKRKRKKPKFSAKSARNWIYVTGLPLDTTEEELSKYFSKVGIIDIDPESLKPKIKLYRHKKKQLQTCASGEENGHGNGSGGELKGDASICYARPESVELALQILDENLFRDGAILSVQRAKFEQHGSTFDMDKSGGNNGGVGGKRRIISESKRRVARLAAIQAVGWDESENGRIAGGLKGLRIIVLMNMFDPRELEHDDDDDNNGDENTGDTRLHALEREIHTECEEIGTVEKITIFSKHPAGVVIVKFVKPNDASDAVKVFNGKVRGNGRKVEASFWDGTTDYTVVDVEKEEKEAEKRLDKFGDWLEEQELPEEFQLRVEEKN